MQCTARIDAQDATQQILEQAEPIANDITRGVIAPGAREVRKNAVPITEEVRYPSPVLIQPEWKLCRELQASLPGHRGSRSGVHSIGVS